MIHLFNQSSVFMKLDEKFEWVPLTISENRALNDWLNAVNKITYYRALIKKGKEIDLVINPTKQEIELQSDLIKKWSVSQGVPEDLFNNLDLFTDKLSQFAVLLQFNKRLTGGKFIYTSDSYMSYISPYGGIYADAYLFIYMKLYGITPKIGSPELPTASSHLPLDKQEELDKETEQTEDLETISVPT